MWMMNDKGFKKLVWVLWTVNIALTFCVCYIVAHFIAKYW